MNKINFRDLQGYPNPYTKKLEGYNLMCLTTNQTNLPEAISRVYKTC